MKKVLICRSNPIDPDPRVEKTARVLSKAQYKLAILGWDRSGKLPLREEREYATIYRLQIKAKYAAGLRNLPYLLMWEICLLHWLIVHRREYQIIHACDFDTVLPSLLVKWLFRKIVIYDIFDFYADHLRKTPDLIKVIIKRLDKWAINASDALILADEARHEQILGAKPKKVIVVNNTPEDIKEKVVAFSLPLDESSFKIAYVGLLQIERGILDILSILEQHPEWSLHLAGFGGDEELILEHAQRLRNIYWYGRVSYEKALSIMAQSDVIIGLYDPQIPNHRYASPNKLFEAMMLAKPIIVAENTNIDRIVQEFHCGVVVPYGDKVCIENALQFLSDNPSVREEKGLNGRKAYGKYYSWEIMSHRIISLYEELTSLMSSER